jgi:DNA polymerase-3 subunit epsilon
MEFVAVDVETANADWASICQIGIAHFNEAGVHDTWTSLIDPEDYFDEMNISIHGITADDVRDQPRFSDVFSEVASRLSGSIVVHHMPFDRVAIARAAARYSLQEIEARWLDSARVARRAWIEFAKHGYGLKNLCGFLGIPLDHHNALSDAVACGTVLARAAAASAAGIEEWLVRARRPLGGPVAREGDPEGPLFGERVLFTGALSLPRREAASLAERAGCDVASTPSRHITILVVGAQDLRRTLGRTKSSKHRKVEELIAGGCDVSIIGEEDFMELVGERSGTNDT